MVPPLEEPHQSDITSSKCATSRARQTETRVTFKTMAPSIADENAQNGTGSISVADLEEGLRQLNVFDGMSKEQARLATRRFDHSGDDTVSLPEFLAFVGRPYAANDRPLETKLRRVLLKAESVRAWHVYRATFLNMTSEELYAQTTEGPGNQLPALSYFAVAHCQLAWQHG